MRRGIGVLLLTAIVVLAVLPALRASADTQPPVFVDAGWTPRRPIHPENITLHANVADADGVAWVQSTFCYYTAEGAWICLYNDLADPDGDGTWTVVPNGPGGFSTMAEPIIGAQLGFAAGDTASNIANTTKVWILFVDSIAITLESEVTPSEPGQPVAVNGTAFYEANSTAPAEGVSVTVSVPGSSAEATVDATGSFSANLTAPAVDGTYALTATATDRTLTGTDESVLAVSTVPRPDLRVGAVTPANPLPRAGEPTFVTFQVANVGTADAVGAQVFVEVSRSGTWITIYDERVNLAKGGTVRTLSAEFTPEEGVHMIRVRVDPGGEFDELNETNNEGTATISARAPDLPVLWIAAGGGIAAIAVAGGVLAVRRRRPLAASPPSDKGKAL